MTDRTQEIFDIVCAGLFAQGGPSRTENGNCAYRNEIGRKCAGGFLIAEDKYQPSFEGRAILDLVSRDSDAFSILPVTVAERLCIKELQLRHDDLARASKDDTFFMIQFPKEAREIAKYAKLSTAKLDALASPC